MFEKASRLKLRFDTARGALSTEDLWDLPLKSTVDKPNLNDIAKALYKDLKETGEIVSFVDDTQQADEKLTLKFEIVKHVIAVKKAEAEAKAQEKAKADQKQQILGIIAQKKNEQLSAASIEELEAKLAAL